jgi:hypothetical protein
MGASRLSNARRPCDKHGAEHIRSVLTRFLKAAFEALRPVYRLRNMQEDQDDGMTNHATTVGVSRFETCFRTLLLVIEEHIGLSKAERKAYWTLRYAIRHHVVPVHHPNRAYPAVLEPSCLSSFFA